MADVNRDERRRRLNERLRAEFIAGAEAEWRKRTGRPMTAEELERVLRRSPGTCRRGRFAVLRTGVNVEPRSGSGVLVERVGDERVGVTMAHAVLGIQQVYQVHVP